MRTSPFFLPLHTSTQLPRPSPAVLSSGCAMTEVNKSPFQREKSTLDGLTPHHSVHALEVEVTELDRQRLLKKIDFHILPFISLLYLLSFL